MSPLRRRVLTTAALVAAVVVAIVLARHPLAGWLIARGVSVATGYDVRFGQFRLGGDHAAFFDVHVRKNGDPFLDAGRVDVTYQLRDIFPGGAHRYGFASLSLAGPIISIVRHADGGYNVGGGGGAPNASAPPAATQSAAAPYFFSVRVRDGAIRLIDRAPLQSDLEEQEVNHVDIDASVKSNARTTAVLHGRLVGRRTQRDAAQPWPVTVKTLIDDERGFADTHLQAPALPLRGVLGFVIHSRVFRIDDGVARDVDVHVFAVNIASGVPFIYRAGGRSTLAGGRMTIAPLQRPVRDLQGPIVLAGDGLWTTGLTASLAGAPLHVRGGLYDLAHPTFRLGVAGDGALHELRGLFGFSRAQPVTGRAHIETLIESKLGDPLVRTAIAVDRGAWNTLPLRGLRGQIDYHAGTVAVEGVRARYGPARIAVDGRILVWGAGPDVALTVAAHGPGRTLPYAENLAPESNVDALALITGGAGYRARGALAAHGGGLDGNGFFDVDERGVGEFAPFAFSRSDGSSLIGGLRLERTTSTSAAWVSARNYRIDVPRTGALLPGLHLPGFPPIAGIVDGVAAGGGPPSGFALAGSVEGRDLRIGTIALGQGRTRVAGTLADVRLGDLHVNGPLGRFDGAGAAARGAFALRGRYDGALERLTPLTGDQHAHGAVHGAIAAIIDGPDAVVQSTDARLADASVRGVAVDAARGTIAVHGRVLHVIAADASIGGRRAVAREGTGTIAVSAPDVPSSALRGTGLPLQAGNVSLYGDADLRGATTKFNGLVAVAHGRSDGYAVAGDARIALDGARMNVRDGTGALGATYGTFAGRLDGIGAPSLAYDLDAGVGLGDLALLRGDLHVPVRHLDGSFAAELRVRGTDRRPRVTGDVRIPEGSYNGLAFRDATARIAIDAHGVDAEGGTITVGSTRAAVDASISGPAFSIAFDAPAANLADFDDYFDEGETLSGTGRLAVAFRTDAHRITSHGDVALAGLRYRRFPLGTTTARWSMAGASVRAQIATSGAAGALSARGSVTPSGGDPLPALLRGRYDGAATLTGVDLGTWLPAAGLQIPLLGRVDARAGFTGRYPQLALAGDATLHDGLVAGFPVNAAHVTARAAGTRIAITRSDADLGFARFGATGTIGLGPRDPVALDLRIAAPNVGRALHAIVPVSRGYDVAGALEADLRVGGTFAHPRIDGGFDLSGARYNAFVVPRAIGVVALSGHSIALRDAEVMFGKGTAFVAGGLPLQIAPFGLGPPSAPLSFDVTAQGVDLAQFAPLFPAGTMLGGTIDGRFGVEGTVARPRLLGSLALSGGSYRSAFERAPIQNVDARLAFGGTTVAVQAFHAVVGGGTLDGSGRLDLPFAQAPQAGYAVDLRARRARLDFPAYGRGTVDGNLRLASGAAHPLLSGDVALSDATIPFAALYRTSGTGGDPGASRPAALDPAFDIHAVAGKRVRVTSAILDIGATGSVDLTGTFSRPQLAGEFTSTGGTFSTYNHAFRVQSADVRFDPAAGVVPDIALRAVAHVTNPDPDPTRNIAGSADITVTVSGPADAYAVSYSSNPPYSEEQIAGLLLDLPAILGAVNFNRGQGGTLLPGSPGESNVLLPPGVSAEQIGTISLNQEVFSLLNGQFTQRALSPVEHLFEGIFGLSDLGITVDYGGGIGYSARRRLGQRDFYFLLSQTVSYPERLNLGLELRPDPVTNAVFSYFRQNGITSLITTDTPGRTSFSSSRRLVNFQPLGDRTGFSLTLTRRTP